MTKEQFIFFYGGHFSQWSQDAFDIDGVRYNCAEQYMMAEKARLFEDESSEKQIMAASHPRDQKAIGRLVRNFDEDRWNAVARDVVYRGNYAKFTQNKSLRDYIVGTEGHTIVEASPYDAIWGIKLAESDPDCQDRSKWKGTNWLGEVCMKVRDDIIAGIESTDFNWSSTQKL